jgi:excisionase family DNA binding protein
MDRLVWTVFEAAQALGVHHLTLRKAIARGEIRAVKIGKRVMVPKGELERLLGGQAPKVVASS